MMIVRSESFKSTQRSLAISSRRIADATAKCIKSRMVKVERSSK